MPARRPPTWTPTPRQILVTNAYVREGTYKAAAHALELAEDTVRGTLEAMRKRAPSRPRRSSSTSARRAAG
jgi:hypothetical protein